MGSDAVVVERQLALALHGLDPGENLLVARARAGETAVRTEEFAELLDRHGDRIAVVLLSLPVFVLFGIVFFWTPPHYWPLALRFKADYQAARVPMLPAVADNLAVSTAIVRYSWAMVATSLLLTPVAGMTWLYTAVALLLGAMFLVEAYALRRRVRTGVGDVRAMRLFHGSISYLSLLFLAVAIDPFLA